MRRGSRHGKAWLAALGAVVLLASEHAIAATGPLQSPLRVTTMYMQHGQSVIYVAFQSGAMPGCYGNAGGYLWTSNSSYKELYTQFMTMVASGGIRASVVYTVNAQTNNWGDCTIDGIFLTP